MVIFIDTSSLLKRYISEAGSSVVDDYFIDDNDICISPITEIEIHAALNRKLRDGDIDYGTMQKALKLWHSDYSVLSKIIFSEKLSGSSIQLIDTHGIKTLDAIQIGSAIISDSEEFVTSDRQMFKVFQAIDIGKCTFI